MSVCVSKKIQGQEEETMVMQKQGIVTILGSNHGHVTSLRRTLSADMSSKTWLSQNGFSPMKKIASSEQISHSLTNSTEEIKQDQFQIWTTIQKKDQPEELDLWSSILSQKANDEAYKLTTTTTPYVHPLVRRSKNCLSEKSLQICTESLGSETGSDGFSSETGDSDEEEEEEKEQITHEVEEFHVPKSHNYAAKRSLSLPRSFPPPLPSFHMQSRRDNGRLFLQAVELPSQNNFCAHRENGRLVLTFTGKEGCEEDEEVMKIEGDDEAEEVESVKEEASLLLSSGMRLALVMNKPIKLGDSTRNRSRKPKWSNDVVNFTDVDVVQHSPLPPRPRMRAIPSSPISGAFNAYEYYWRSKPVAEAAKFQQSLENNLKSCKDSRRPFLFWEPYCIAT
ncbi:hypothetical protein Fmac_019459 [Flemingia macrophylla]|uniref:FAF domain-containing protein n=1 Tax=Flemingia macrophylla TaxID=520843 RepID=A0ABD1M8K4_9FABA